MSTYDPIALGIQWDRLISIADEIVNALVRTSFSTNVRESYDLSCVVFDRQGRSIAQGTYSVPSFTGTAAATLAHMLQRFPSETLEPGDVMMTNDPWIGTGHLFDINVMQPVFRNGGLVGYVDVHHASAGHRRRRIFGDRARSLRGGPAPAGLQVRAPRSRSTNSFSSWYAPMFAWPMRRSATSWPM